MNNNSLMLAEDYISSGNINGLVSLGLTKSDAETLISLDREIQSQLEVIRASMMK